MHRSSPPKHRHDGTSPLPLGMDWSSPPKKWEGKNTVWPHNHKTGWSYCVMIPSWIVQSDPGGPHDTFLKSVVYYRVHVGVQSPEGLSSSHGVLRRFSDFLNLYTSIKKIFPRKDIPPAPPKHSLLRINSSRLLLEERRRLLEEWMGKLLSDIDVSRSAPVAAFLELEAAARSSFEEWNQNSSETTAAEPSTSTSFADLSSEEEPAHNSNHKNTPLALEHDTTTNSENNTLSLPSHDRKPSSESLSSEVSNLSVPALWDDASISMLENLIGTDMRAEVVIPADQRNKLARILLTMQRRVVTARTDMEDLIARLNQEIAVKEYLNTKVKDLEVELEATKQKSRETLQQAVLVERERVTQIQWDMEELRRKYSELESKLLFEKNEKSRAESEKTSFSGEREQLMQELEMKRDELNKLQQNFGEFEIKSKADIKVLVKEVKSLRNSQSELKKLVNRYSEEKSELQRALHNETRKSRRANLSHEKLLRECKILRERLQECTVNNVFEQQEDEENLKITDQSSIEDALDLLVTSDNRVGLLLAEAQLLAREDEQSISDTDDDTSNGESSDNVTVTNGENSNFTSDDEEIRKILTDMFIDNARLTKQLNSLTRYALNSALKQERESEEVPSRKTVLSRFLDR